MKTMFHKYHLTAGGHGHIGVCLPSHLFFEMHDLLVSPSHWLKKNLTGVLGVKG